MQGYYNEHMASNFPKGFYFGATTSAHQVEGGNHNDWSEWETSVDQHRLNTDSCRYETRAEWAARLANKRDWTDYIMKNYPNPLQPENYISGCACDHYRRYEEDFNIAKRLGHNAHRFSIEWSRIEPEEGKFEEREIEHYRKMIYALRERGMEPFVTLWHWTLPLWLAQRGGVGSHRFSEYFTRYVELVVNKLKGDVSFWFTINEPEIYALNAYFRGRWPPQRRGLYAFYRAFEHLIRAHRLAYRAIKRVTSKSLVGVVCNLSDFKSSGGLLNDLLTTFVERFWNHRFLLRVQDEIDQIGLNFYFHNRIRYGFNKNTNERVSDMGWNLHPSGIESVLLDLRHYRKPIYITENGVADAQDVHRAWFITETLAAVRRAIDAGADVRGYFHWSLLDNFEWDEGFWPRFGLVEVDYRTLDRRVRSSALVYKELIERGLSA